jgi:predicted transcriptional regulator
MKTKSITLSLSEKEGNFFSIFSKIKGETKNSGISNFRQILSREKSRLLYICKTKQPDSIYQLAKLLGRNFKSVREDVRILEQFGFIELISSIKKGRERLKPVIDVDQLIVTINLN